MTLQTRSNSSTIPRVTHITTMLPLDTWTTPEQRVTPCETLVADTWLGTTLTPRTSVSQLTETTTATSPSQQESSQSQTLLRSSLVRPTDNQLVTTVHTVTTGTSTRPDVTQTSTCHLVSSLTTSRSLSMEMTATIDCESAVTVTST